MNEPAFPSNRDMRHNPDWDYVEGMSLLDYFAAKAMQSLVGIDNMADTDIARQSYEIADLMLEERKKHVQ